MLENGQFRHKIAYFGSKIVHFGSEMAHFDLSCSILPSSGMIQIVIKTEFYQLWKDGVKLIRTVKKKRTYNLSPTAIAPDFTAQLKRQYKCGVDVVCKPIFSGYNIALPETNQNEMEFKFANEMHSAINTARKKAGVDGLTLNGIFLHFNSPALQISSNGPLGPSGWSMYFRAKALYFDFRSHNVIT